MNENILCQNKSVRMFHLSFMAFSPSQPSAEAKSAGFGALGRERGKNESPRWRSPDLKERMENDLAVMSILLPLL